MLWNGTECVDRSFCAHRLHCLCSPSWLARQPVSESLASYYNRLSRWTRVAHLVGYGGGHDALTVHRALADPAADGRTTSTRLHDLLIELLPPLTDRRVLDAGCGLGGTMIDLARRTRGLFVGVTLSAAQRDAGARAIERAGLADRVAILVQSYDQPPPGSYDVILAIESLGHSPDPMRSVAALAQVLSPGGTIAIVDDMPEREAIDTADLNTFKSGWEAPVLSSAADFETAFNRVGLSLTLDRDLSPLCRPRTLDRIRQLERLNRVLRRALPLTPWRALMDSYRGGLALERLYRKGAVRYRLLMARRPSE
jgi:tocopherol O-methyltransferase